MLIWGSSTWAENDTPVLTPHNALLFYIKSVSEIEMYYTGLIHTQNNWNELGLINTVTAILFQLFRVLWHSSI